VVFCGNLWFSVVICGFLWYSLVFCGILWFSVLFCGIVSVFIHVQTNKIYTISHLERKDIVHVNSRLERIFFSCLFSRFVSGKLISKKDRITHKDLKWRDKFWTTSYFSPERKVKKQFFPDLDLALIFFSEIFFLSRNMFFWEYYFSEIFILFEILFLSFFLEILFLSCSFFSKMCWFFLNPNIVKYINIVV
jgi:hypothetical protein